MAVSKATISSISVVETQGSTGAGGTLITSALLYITPDSGYTISAADVTVGTLPTGVDSVSLSDTVAPYTIENKVKATISLTASYAMPSADTTLTIPFTGSAYLGVKEYVQYHVKIRQDRLLRGEIVTNAITTALGADATGNLNTVTTTLEASGLIPPLMTNTITSAFSGFVEVGKDSVIGQYTVTFSKEDYYHKSMPGLVDTNNATRVPHYGKLFLRPSSQKINSINLVTETTYDLVYNHDRDIEEAACMDTTLQVFPEAIPRDENVITMFKPGIKHVEPKGEYRRMTVVGTPGALFNLKIFSTPDNVIVDLVNAEIPGAGTGALTTGAGKISNYVVEVNFPATATNLNWNVKLTGAEDSSLGTMVPGLIETYVLNQFTTTTINITNTATNSNIIRTGAAAISYKGRGDREIEDLYSTTKGTFNSVKFSTPITWTLTNSVGQTYSVTKANPVLSDFTHTDSATNGGTIVRAPGGFTVTGGGTGTAVIKGVFEISHVGKDDVTINMNLDNIVTLS